MGQEETDGTKAFLANLEKGFGVDSPLNGVFLAMLADPSFLLRRTAQ
jgi:hypothetical protein